MSGSKGSVWRAVSRYSANRQGSKIALTSVANAGTSVRNSESASATSRKFKNFSPTRYSNALSVPNWSPILLAAMHCSIQTLQGVIFVTPCPETSHPDWIGDRLCVGHAPRHVGQPRQEDGVPPVVEVRLEDEL